MIAGSFGLFFAITALLAFQMRRGADPALGAPKPQVVAQATAAPRRIVVRRVIVTRIVEHRRAAARPRLRGAPARAPAAPSARRSPPPARLPPRPAPRPRLPRLR